MGRKDNPRTPEATLSPAAECWWERDGDCTYLVLCLPGDCLGIRRARRVAITDTEAEVLRDLLNDKDWWTDKTELESTSKGQN